MAVVIHPDGYYQITDWHDIVSVGAGSIMWKLVRGYNQRRAVLGRTLRRYEGKWWVDADTIEDAKIVPDSILQHVNFWRELQDVNNWLLPSQTLTDALDLRTFTAPANRVGGTGIDDYNGANAIGDVSFAYLSPIIPQPLGDVAVFGSSSLMNQSSWRRRNSINVGEFGMMAVDDIIGAWLVNDLLRFASFFRCAGNLNGSSPTRYLKSFGSSNVEGCDEAYESSLSSWYDREFSPVERPAPSLVIGTDDLYASQAFVSPDGNNNGFAYYLSPVTYRFFPPTDTTMSVLRTRVYTIPASSPGDVWLPDEPIPLDKFYRQVPDLTGDVVLYDPAPIPPDAFPLEVHGFNCSNRGSRSTVMLAGMPIRTYSFADTPP